MGLRLNRAEGSLLGLRETEHVEGFVSPDHTPTNAMSKIQISEIFNLRLGFPESVKAPERQSPP